MVGSDRGNVETQEHPSRTGGGNITASANCLGNVAVNLRVHKGVEMLM
jgi:hypothetical protein